MRIALALTLAAVIVGAVGGCQKPETTWHTIDSPGEAMMGHPNTHAAAGAWTIKYLGLSDPDWDDEKLYTMMRLHMGKPECPTCPLIVFWDVLGGIWNYLQVNDHTDVQVSEFVRYSRHEDETADFEDYVAAIDNNQPVILSWCYDGRAADPAAATKRAADCFSTVGIGYVRQGDTGYVICHHGLDAPLDEDIDGKDRVAPFAAGLQGQAGPWDQPGTALYRWDGDYQNLVLVFVE